ncbi:hypothetical protein PFICI_07191 [Pestalotiopsis fici W106-1]|uniref:Uncharacterized protein n=1 Tax=Pestalotiopsis fici (strain W106-1 / CGMCC3.15140) TaxID=1229662 RepID=W3X831_PESFW|nr:uncharacterized protein PFICI_07191 [Pestalotiopsis fici W106-1]ETS82189.1 hypothetical protein PFICI_07191 [Pestalotiopsis fici W106-1]
MSMPSHSQDQGRALLPPAPVSPLSTNSTENRSSYGHATPSIGHHHDQYLGAAGPANFGPAVNSFAPHNGSGYDAAYSTIPRTDEHHVNGYNENRNSSGLSQSLSDASTPSEQENKPWTGKPWNPFCLRKIVLLLLSVTFLLCLLATALMYHFSQQYNGLSAEDEAKHYGWTYGPSAVLTVILYLWYSIDLSVRSLQPWHELQRGPKSAETTLLLDYISPLLTTSLWRSLKNRHWPVFLTIVGRLLILLTIAFSTALLVLSPTEVKIQNIPFTVSGFDTESFKLDNVGPVAADMYYGVNFGNLAAPIGTTADTCVPPLSRQINKENNNIPSNAELRATVTGLSFDVDCEVLDIQDSALVSPSRGPQNDASSPGDYMVVNVTTPSCNIKGAIVGIGPNSRTVTGFNPNQPIHDHQARVDDYVCNLEWNYHDIYDASLGAGPLVNVSSTAWTNTSSDHRILLTVSDLSLILLEGNINLESITALLCKPSYLMNDNAVVYNEATQTAKIESSEMIEAANPDLPGFPRTILGSAVLSTVDQVNTLDLNDERSNYSVTIPPFLGLMKMHSNVSSMSQFENTELLQESFLNVFNGVAAQLAHQMLLNASDEKNSIVGTATFTQDRLHVTELSTAIMCAALGILSIMSAGLIFLVPKDVVTSEPGSVLAIASFVNLSSGTVGILQGLGHVRDKTIRRALAPYIFTSAWPQERGKLIIETSTRPQTQSTKPPGALKFRLEWWRPLGSQNWFLFLSFAIPLILLGLLELFQRRSDKYNGFVTIRSQWGQMVANYVPAIISIIIGAIFSSIVAASAVFAPYASLSKGPTPPSRSVGLTYISRVGPRLGYTSLKHKHFGLSIITLAQLIASILTIILSGLYSTVEVPFQEDVLFQQLDKFNISDTLSVANPNAGLITKLITYYDLKFPTWTYDSIALPQVSVADTTSIDGLSNATIRSRLPGIRGDLNCTSMPSRLFDYKISDQSSYEDRGREDFPLWSDYVPKNGMDLLLTISRPLPAKLLCDDAGENDNRTWTWQQHFYVRNDSTPSPFGKASRIYYHSDSSQIDDLMRRSIDEDTELPRLHGCPTIGITLGHITAESPHNVTDSYNTTTIEWNATNADIGTLLCWPKFKEFDVDITFDGPSLEISDQSPPVIDESTIKVVENPTTGLSTWELDYQGHDYNFWDSLKNTNDLETLYGLLQDDRTTFDPFILALITGKYKVPLEQISGENNTEALLREAGGLWGRYMAQSISQNMRLNMTASASAPSSRLAMTRENHPLSILRRADSSAVTYPATLAAPSAGSLRRLKQNASSKVILQVMLGVMSLCVVSMRALSSFSKVLPHNPCSIAGTASFVVDGNLQNMTASGSEKHLGSKKGQAVYTRLYPSNAMDDETSETGQKYSMGWWDDGENERFGVRRV